MPAYFDTNVIRYLRTGLDAPLSADLRGRIVVSPISAIEVLSQVADPIYGDDALHSIHRFRDWLGPQAVMFDWLETYCAHTVFGIQTDDEIFPIVTEMLNRALLEDVVSPGLRNGARALREINEQAKHRKARLFQQAADRLRPERLTAQQLDNRIRRYITAGIEQRVDAAPCARTHEQIEGNLSAYCEFHTRSVIGAVQNVGFRFESREHLNDHFDGEQLLYLSSAENQFISCDTGFNCVKQTEQGPRVHILPALTLQNPATAVHALEAVIAPCSVVHPQL